jgi:undecaprenyl diphosphate synthase
MSSQTEKRIPNHVAIIMDGNGRWARQRGLPRIAGHRQGVKATQAVVEAAGQLGIRYLTLYAFSAENFGRPRDEIHGLLTLLEDYLPRELDRMLKQGIRLHIIGRLDRFPDKTRRMIEEALERTRHLDNAHLVIALGYGARQELVDAVRSYTAAVLEGREHLNNLSYEAFAQHLHTGDIPDPDLVIRTSGEHRISNFLLLQSAYAEYYFSDVLWPDFGRQELERALEAYARRERRFGLTSEQVVTGSAPTSKS